MADAAYHILAIVVGVVALFKGYHNGFTGQISGILGFAFGTVCAHVFGEEVEEMLRGLFPGISHVAGQTFIYSVLAVALIYLAVFLLFRLLTGVLRSAMQVFGLGLLDRLLGAAFCTLKYMLLLSIAYNLMICLNPRSPLMRYANADDGNIVECVLMLAPEFLGCYSFEDLAHILQLREARKISRNYPGQHRVITIEPATTGRKILIENA